MENDWDLQAVPIASRSPLQGMFPRLGTNGIMRPSVDALNPFKSVSTVTPAFPQHVYENSDHTLAVNCCPQCSRSYEQELAELVAEFEKSSSEAKVEATTKTSLPQWLQSAKLHSSDVKTADQSKNKDQELLFKQKSQELQKKWSDKCSTLHPNFHHNLSSERIAPRTPSMTGFCNPNLLVQPPLQPKLQPTRHLGESLQLNSNKVGNQRLEHVGSLPGSPVRTDLVLGQTRAAEATPEQAREEHTKDLLGCISSEPLAKGSMESIKFAKGIDADSFKKLLKGLMEKAWWQPEAASNVATTLTQCKLGNGKRRTGSKGSTWLLFTGPDRVGMKKMASVVSEQVCRSTPTMISLGSRRDDGESNVHVRGKTALDRIVEAVRRSPFSIIMLEDIDEADMLVRGSIKRAMERGRLTDSHGREISLGNIIFILTGNWSPVSLKDSGNRHLLDEKKLASLASGGWQLRLTISEKSAKRRANWLCDEEDRTTRPRREMGSSVSFDLNQAADAEDYRTDGSLNSSDLTIDHEDGLGAIASVPHELANSVDGTIVFKPVDFGSVRCEIKKTITKSFSTIVDDKLSIQVEDDSLEKILGGVWNGQTSLTQWAEKVLVPSFQQLKTRLPTSVLCSSDESKVICLEPDADSDRRSNGDWLPSKIRVMVDGV